MADLLPHQLGEKLEKEGIRWDEHIRITPSHFVSKCDTCGLIVGRGYTYLAAASEASKHAIKEHPIKEPELEDNAFLPGQTDIFDQLQEPQ